MKKSAGILLYRRNAGQLQVLLAHPGGPFWRKKDLGAWTLPKGEIGEGEEPLDAARREFTEETGFVADGPFAPLAPVRQPGGKTVFAWAAEGDCDPDRLCSNTFSMEWPPRSGKFADFPEIDRAAWFQIPEAKDRILKGQAAFLDQLEALIS